MLRVTALRVWGLVCSGAVLLACGSQSTPAAVATAVPAPVPPDPRAGARCVSSAAHSPDQPVADEALVALTLGPRGPRWVSSNSVWDVDETVAQGLPTGVTLAQGSSVLAYVGDAYLAVTRPGPQDTTGRSGLAVVDGALRAGRAVHGRTVAAALCGATVTETPTGALLAYYAPEAGACGGPGGEYPWFVQRLDARGDGRGPPVALGATGPDEHPRFAAVRPRWESGRVVVAVERANGEALSMVLGEDLRVAVQQRGSLVCGRAGCARFAVVAPESGSNYDSSAGTVRMDVLGYSNTFTLGLFAEQIVDARANGDFALVVYSGRVNGATTARGVAVVNVPLRRLESVYDSVRNVASLTWGEESPPGPVLVRTTERGFALGAGGYTAGGYLHRSIVCSR